MRCWSSELFAGEVPAALYSQPHETRMEYGKYGRVIIGQSLLSPLRYRYFIVVSTVVDTWYPCVVWWFGRPKMIMKMKTTFRLSVDDVGDRYRIMSPDHLVRIRQLQRLVLVLVLVAVCAAGTFEWSSSNNESCDDHRDSSSCSLPTITSDSGYVHYYRTKLYPTLSAFHIRSLSETFTTTSTWTHRTITIFIDRNDDDENIRSNETKESIGGWDKESIGGWDQTHLSLSHQRTIDQMVLLWPTTRSTIYDRWSFRGDDQQPGPHHLSALIPPRSNYHHHHHQNTHGESSLRGYDQSNRQLPVVWSSKSQL